MKATKINKVLIALDLYQTAQKVAETGYSFAKAVGADIILLQVISDPVYRSLKEHLTITGFAGLTDRVPLKLESIEGLKTASQHYLDDLKHYLGDEAIQTVVKEGDIAESILKTAKNLHADAIVMGYYGWKESENEISGLTTKKVLNHTTKPLFIVPVK